MKILIATDAPLDLPSGVATFNRNIGEILKDQGHKIYIFDRTGKSFKKLFQKVDPDYVQTEETI